MIGIISGHPFKRRRLRLAGIALFVLIACLVPRLAAAESIVFDGKDCSALTALDRPLRVVYDAGIFSRVSRRTDALVMSDEKSASGAANLNIWYKGVLPWKAGSHAFEYKENMDLVSFVDGAQFESAYTLRDRSWHMSIAVRDFETVTIGACPVKTVLVSFSMRPEADNRITTRHSIYAPELRWVLGWTTGEPPKTFEDAKTRVVIIGFAE